MQINNRSYLKNYVHLLLLVMMTFGCDDEEAKTNAGEMAGENAAGEEMAGENVAGEEMAGETVAGEEVAGETVAGEEVAGEEMAGEAVAGEEMAGEEMAGEAVAGEEMAGEAVAGEEMAGEEMAGEEMTCESSQVLIEIPNTTATYLSFMTNENNSAFGQEQVLKVGTDDGFSVGTSGMSGSRFALIKGNTDFLTEEAQVTRLELCVTPRGESMPSPYLMQVWGVSEACGQWTQDQSYQEALAQTDCTSFGFRFSPSAAQDGDILNFIDGTTERCVSLNPATAREYLTNGVSLHPPIGTGYAAIELYSNESVVGQPKFIVQYDPCPNR